MNVTVTSYNIHKAEGLDRRVDLSRIADVLREIDADMVGIQEIYGPQAEQLAADLGMTMAMGVTRQRDELPYGNAILTRLAVRGSPDHVLRDLPLAVATGYGIGAIPAAVVGFIVATRDILSRPVNLALAALLGAVVGAIWAVYLVNEGEDYVLAVLVFVGSVVATAICWWVTRQLERNEVVG